MINIDVAAYENATIRAFEERKYQKSEEFCNRLLTVSPENCTALFYLVLINIRKKKFEAALSIAKRLLALYPNEPNANLNCGVIWFNLGNIKRARFYYKRELSKNRFSAEAIYNLALISLSNRKWRAAASYLERVFKLGYKPEEVARSLAECYFKLGLLDKEIKFYHNFLEIYPNNAWAFENLGAAYLEKRMKKKALLYLMRAKRRNPGGRNLDEYLKAAEEL